MNTLKTPEANLTQVHGVGFSVPSIQSPPERWLRLVRLPSNDEDGVVSDPHPKERR